MNDSRNNFWEQCLDTFRENFDPTTFNAFIEPITTHLEDGTLVLTMPNQVAERWGRRHIGAILRSMATAADLTIEYRIAAKTATAPDAAAQPIIDTSRRRSTSRETGLRKDLTFDNFVQGHANEIPLVAAKRLSGGGSDINPLFIYGNTGLGKTHLVQAIGNNYLQRHPGRRVLYLTARDYMNEVVHAFRLNQHEQFKERFRDLDMLIIDDIQYIGGDKIRTQEEFFFLFNSLYENSKEVIITCDRAPGLIKDQPTRLTSRFNAGLTALINPPEFELRMDIVRQKAAQSKVDIEDDVIRFIAEHIKSNVRELEGALKRVLATADFQGKSPSLKICQEALPDLIGIANITVTSDTIKEKVAHFYNVRVGDLSSKKRHRAIAHPRHIAVYLCRQMTNMSLPEIGQHFGKRNHTTVLHSCRHIDKAIKTNKALSDEISHLQMAIREA